MAETWHMGELHGRPAAVPGPPPHGTRQRYISRCDACRCEACTGANTAYHRELRRRKRGAEPGRRGRP